MTQALLVINIRFLALFEAQDIYLVEIAYLCVTGIFVIGSKELENWVLCNVNKTNLDLVTIQDKILF